MGRKNNKNKRKRKNKKTNTHALNDTNHSLMSSVSLEIGGVVVDTHYGENYVQPKPQDCKLDDETVAALDIILSKLSGLPKAILLQLIVDEDMIKDKERATEVVKYVMWKN